MASLEDRVAALEAEIVSLREKVTDAHTLAAHADRDVAEFREELRAQTKLINLMRLDMGTVREDLGTVREDLGTVREEMTTGLSQVREEMATGLGQVREEMASGSAQLREEMATGFAHVAQLLERRTRE